MQPFLIYLLQVNIALALFYLLYALVLKRDTFLRIRRLFFLSAIVFSLVYPFWTVPALGDFWVSNAVLGNAEAMVLIDEPSMAIVADSDETATPAIPWGNIILVVYSIITVVFVLRLLGQLLSILRINLKCKKENIFGIPVYQLRDDITPFSFFNRIFIHPESYSETELSQILLHEQIHVRQRHSVDIMLVESLCLFSWWNPFMWLMKREMAMNLEYLADNGVLRNGIDSREYQYHLLRLTYHASAVKIVNNFNVSQLKQRIMMMNKSKSPTMTLAKYLLVLPLAFLLVFANSCVNREKKSDTEVATEQVETTVETPPEETVVVEDNSEIFVVTEQQPEFPGGNAAMMKFLGDSIKYPVKAQEDGIQGRVICNFIVEKDGRLSGFQVIRGVDPLLDNEALRVLKIMPNWIPGKQRGENVRTRFTLPVVFRLHKASSTGAPPPPPPPMKKSETDTESSSSTTQPSETNEVFVVVDKQPEYPGGGSAMTKFLADNIDYPKVAQEKGTQGRVICNFIVEKDGSLSDFQVVRGVDPLLDNEALRVLKSMPKWNPGSHKNVFVRVRYTLPVVFRLQN